jgi:hypothetical protein
MTTNPQPMEKGTASLSAPREVVIAKTPLRDDSVTIAPRPRCAEPPASRDPETCPRCGRDFRPSGRQRFCSAACRQAFWRQGHATPLPSLPVSGPRRIGAIARRLTTVYQCPACDTRLLGQQRCPDCGVFCRRVGPGGPCPHCEEPVALADLLGAGN